MIFPLLRQFYAAHGRGRGKREPARRVGDGGISEGAQRDRKPEKEGLRADEGEFRPLAQLLFVPGLPALGAAVGLLLGWRLWKRLWGPRVIRDPDRKKK